MGMYTELCLNVRLKKHEEAIRILSYMVNGGWDEACHDLPVHPFFQTPRWRMVLTCSSHYFVPFHNSVIRKDASGNWFLCTRSDLKNYNNEIELFIDWLKPHIDAFPGAFLGYSRYEETIAPTLHFMKGE